MQLFLNLIFKYLKTLRVNYAIFLTCMVFFALAKAQKVQVNYFFLNQIEEAPKYFQKKHLIAAPEFIASEIEQAKLLLTQKGYYSALFQDSLREGKYDVYINPGNKYQGLSVFFDAELLPWAQQLTQEKLMENGSIHFRSPQDYARTLENLISIFHNHGYPFASFSFSDFEVHDEWVSTHCHLKKGQKMLWKDWIVKGDSSISVQTLQQLLNIKTGEDFSLEKLKEMDIRLSQLSYIDIIKPSEFVFTKDGVLLFLYLKSAKISNFNGALGLQPDPISQKIGLTGDLQLKLTNTLKRAEQLEMNWRSIKPATQLLNLRCSFPYLFHTLLGTEVKFHLYKRDSTFLEVNSNLAIQYNFANNFIVKGVFSYKGSNRLYAASGNSAFPNVQSLRNTMYGLGLNYKKLNYLPNPAKGLNVNLEALLGTRKTLNDSTENELTSKFLVGWEHFIPIHKRWVLRYFVSFESYQAPMVYSNECYRFGGLNSQRGFNEENFLATSLSTNQLEIRYLLDKNSAVFAFFDQTIYENNSNSSYKKDLPFGFGVGANIGSKVGIFSLVYALGSENHNPLDVRSGKIHFGYIAYF